MDFAAGTVLGDQEGKYRLCVVRGLIVAATPTWLERSYSEAISKLDVGLLDRCLLRSNITAAVLRSERLRQGHFLDRRHSLAQADLEFDKTRQD